MISKDEIIIDRKKYISLKRASEITGYTKDYVGQLCRLEKISCHRSGRDWFIDIDDLNAYKNKKTAAKKEAIAEKEPVVLNTSNAEKKSEILQDIYKSKIQETIVVESKNKIPESFEQLAASNATTTQAKRRMSKFEETVVFITIIFAVLISILLLLLVYSPDSVLDLFSYLKTTFTEMRDNLVYFKNSILFVGSQFSYLLYKSSQLLVSDVKNVAELPATIYLSGINFWGERITNLASSLAEITFNWIK